MRDRECALHVGIDVIHASNRCGTNEFDLHAADPWQLFITLPIG